MLKFSVLLPIYNREFLRASICNCMDAILANSVLPTQIVVVVDGPLDWNIDHQLDKYSRLVQLDIFHLPTQVGLVGALNFGIGMCRYEFVARVDADDFCHPDRFSEQCRLAELGYNLIGSDIEERDELGQFVSIKRMPQDREDITSYARRRNPFNHMTVFFRKKLVTDVGGYPHFFLKEDYALWVLLLSHPEVVPINVPKCLMLVTAGDNMYRRRASLRVVFQELKFQKLLWENLDKSLILCIVDFIIRFFYIFIPFSIKKNIYLHILRTK